LLPNETSKIERLPAKPRIARAAWLLASIPPGVFLTGLFALVFYAAPEHDDFCFAYLNASSGFVKTVAQFYSELTGRILPLLLIQVPGAISTSTGIGLLPAYSISLAIVATILFSGLFLAASLVFPRASGLPRTFLALSFAASVLGAAPSVRDLLYWLPAVACYVPPSLCTIFILGTCARTARDGTGFSRTATILVCSILLRYARRQPLQAGHHLLIAAVILVSWAVVVLAPGNSMRMAAQASGAGNVSRALYEALRFSLVGFGRFLREPAIIGWLLVTALFTLAASTRDGPARDDDRKLAYGIGAIALFCCYFEYFAHEYSTGIRLVERAQNQALILLLFSSTLAVSFLTEAFRTRLEPLFGAAAVLKLDSAALPCTLGLLIAASLYFSSTGFLLRLERNELYDYHRESVERDALLTTSGESTVAVPTHQHSPTLLMSADVTANISCIAGYYRKSTLIPVEPKKVPQEKR
jgi:hypothetical protein